MKIYIMNVTPLLEEPLFQKALSFVDRQRAEKVKQLKVREEQVRSLGAGLLLQYGLFREKQHRNDEKQAAETAVFAQGMPKLQEVSVAEVLQMTDLPIAVSFTYRENGKPYLQREFADLFFNLSHSGEYAACVISRKEVGMDLQYKREDIRPGLSEYLLTEKERKLLTQCVSRKEYKDRFYFFFSAKEAYIKLTGRGMRQDLKKLEVDWTTNKMLQAETKETLACLWASLSLSDYSLVVAQKSPFCIQ